ncbi:MAG: outer membrane beta-barrel protein [Bacteroidales bacterium]|jgi:hypothetical protein
MKTKIFVLALGLIFNFSLLHSQHSIPKVNLAIHLQPHINWIHGDESFIGEAPVRMGIEGGLRLDFRAQRFYAWSLGVNLNQTGGNILYNDVLVLDLDKGRDTLRSGTKVTYNLQYVEIPVALKFFLPEIGYSTWFAEIGLDPMWNIRALINANDNNVEKEPFQQGVAKFNLAYHTGIGIHYSLGGRLSLQFALLYKNTFLDITRENEIRKADNLRINQIGLNIGLVF